MKSISQYLFVAALAISAVACQPYFPMVPPSGAVITEQEFTENWYVTLEGTGVKNGSDWNNALPFKDFMTMISNPASNLAEAGIHIQEGVYPATAANSISQISKTILCIRGGYSKELEYDDLSECDPEMYPTIFTGDINQDGVANEGDGAFAMVTEGGNVRFENITFKNFYQSATISADSKVNGCGSAVFGIKGAYLSTSVECNNCIFEGNVNGMSGNTSKEGGPCAFITEGYFKARNCIFIKNSAASRGGALRVNSSKAIIFMDRCYLSQNTLGNGGFGSAIQCSAGVVCLNNTTMVGNTGPGSTLNGGGAFFIANTTVVDSSNPNGSSNAAFRCESKAAADATVINSVFTSTVSNGYGLIMNSNAIMKSKGYNVFKTLNVVSGSTNPVVKADAVIDATLTGSDMGNCWSWDISQVADKLESYAIADEIYDAAVAFNPVEYSSISVLGRTFASWVTPVSFSVDGRGEARGEDGFQPGAYDPNLD